MTELELLSNEVSKCPIMRGVQRKRRYSTKLKKRIMVAIAKHGPNLVSKTIGIPRSSIARWPIKTPAMAKNTKINNNNTKSRPIIIKELPAKTNNRQLLNKDSDTTFDNAFVKIMSPTGFSLELNADSAEKLRSIVSTFIGRES